MKLTETKAQRGTAEHKAANQTLTLTGTDGITDTYSDLGIAGKQELYEKRLAKARDAGE